MDYDFLRSVCLAIAYGFLLAAVAFAVGVAIGYIQGQIRRARIAALNAAGAGPQQWGDQPLENLDVAEQRANALLLRFLTPAQRQEWREQLQVTVRGQRYDFVVSVGRPISIAVFHKTGRCCTVAGYYPAQIGSASGHPANMPIPDRVLAQVMAVRHNLGDIERRACGVEGMKLD